MDDVVLRDHADLVAHDRVVLVNVEAVEKDLALLRLLLPGKGLEQSGLSGARGAHNGQQFIARQGEGDAVQELELAIVNGKGQVLTDQLPARAGGDLDLAQAVRADRHKG